MNHNQTPTESPANRRHNKEETEMTNPLDEWNDPSTGPYGESELAAIIEADEKMIRYGLASRDTELMSLKGYEADTERHLARLLWGLARRASAIAEREEAANPGELIPPQGTQDFQELLRRRDSILHEVRSFVSVAKRIGSAAPPPLNATKLHILTALEREIDIAAQVTQLAENYETHRPQNIGDMWPEQPTNDKENTK